MKDLLALESDGRVDLLTGLDAPEIFYRYVEKAIASARRDRTAGVALVRFRLIGPEGESRVSDFIQRPSVDADDGMRRADANVMRTNDLAYTVAKLGRRIAELTRSDENLARLGELTFVLVARIRDDEELHGLLYRFEIELSQFDMTLDGGRLTVDIAGYRYQQGESLLDFLERAHV